MYRRNPNEEETNIPIQKWINSQTVGDEMLWKGAWGRQLEFVRDSLTAVFCYGLHWTEAQEATTVISTHRSKSIVLPVYKMYRGDLGLTMVFGNNFYNWKVSVISEIPVNADYEGLCHTTPPIEKDYTGDELASVYFEGFPPKYIFSYYKSSNRKQYSAEVGGNYAIWAFVLATLKGRGAVEPFEWHTRETHIKQLEEDRRKTDEWAARRKAEGRKDE